MWLFAITRNLVVDHARRRAVRPAVPVEAEVLIALAGTDRGFDDATMTAWTVHEALRLVLDEMGVQL